MHELEPLQNVKLFLPWFLLVVQINRVQSDVQQVLDHGITRGHHHSDSTGSAGSSRSNSTSLRDNSSIHDGRNPRISITNRARGQALERDVAKLFKQKVQLFTKIEFTQVMFVLSSFFLYLTVGWFHYDLVV